MSELPDWVSVEHARLKGEHDLLLDQSKALRIEIRDLDIRADRIRKVIETYEELERETDV